MNYRNHEVMNQKFSSGLKFRQQLDRPTYKKLVKAIQRSVENQKSDSCGIVSITKGHFIYSFKNNELDLGFANACQSLGLVDDNTGTNTYTLPGHSVHDYYGTDNIDDLKKEIRKDLKDLFEKGIV